MGYVQLERKASEIVTILGKNISFKMPNPDLATFSESISCLTWCFLLITHWLQLINSQRPAWEKDFFKSILKRNAPLAVSLFCLILWLIRGRQRILQTKKEKNGRKKVKEFFAVIHINTKLFFSHVTLDFSYIDILLINLHIPTKGTESTSEVIFQFNSKIWSLMSLSLMCSQI